MGGGGGTAYGLTVIGNFGLGLLVPSFRLRSVSSNSCPKDFLDDNLSNEQDPCLMGFLGGVSRGEDPFFACILFIVSCLCPDVTCGGSA